MSNVKLRLVWYVERLQTIHWSAIARGGQMPGFDAIMEMSDREAEVWIQLVESLCREGVI